MRYTLGVGNITDAIRRTVMTLAGQREDEMRERAARFYEEVVRPLYRLGAL